MNRHVGLDVLRAAAVLLVFARHLPEGPLTRIGQVGWVGVDLFFVLSGFLVSGLLFREYERHGEIHVGRFLIRRGFKIYPAYYVFLLLTVLWSAWIGVAFTWLNVGVHVAYLQNYGFAFYDAFPDYWGHTWSLAVEEHFYLLLSVVMLWLSRGRGPQPFRAIPWICLGTSIVCLGLRMLTMQLVRPVDFGTHYVPTHLRLDSLTTGVAFSYAYHFHRHATVAFVRRWAPAFVPVGLGLFLVLPTVFMLHDHAWMWTYGMTAVAGGAVLLLAVGVVHEWPRIAPIRLLAALGVHSYSIYLWHFFVFLGFQPLLILLLTRLGIPPGYPVYYAFCLVYPPLAILVGIAASRIVEAPALQLRDRFWPSRSGTAIVEVSVAEAAADGDPPAVTPIRPAPAVERVR